MNTMQIKPSSVLLIFLVGLIIAISLSGKSKSMAEAPVNSPSPTPSSSAPAPSGAAVYIVYTDGPADGIKPESFYLRTLTSVLGSEKAANESLVHVYKNAATGFSAKLTPKQVSKLEKQPGVLNVVRSRNLKLPSGPSAMNMRI